MHFKNLFIILCIIPGDQVRCPSFLSFLNRYYFFVVNDLAREKLKNKISEITRILWTLRVKTVKHEFGAEESVETTVV